MDKEITIKLITDKSTSDNSIVFDIYGNETVGLHKSIINSLRRTLLSSINTVGFRTSIDSNDLYIMNIYYTELH